MQVMCIWLREVRKIGEREDEPPEEELDVRVLSKPHLDQLRREIDQIARALKKPR